MKQLKKRLEMQDFKVQKVLILDGKEQEVGKKITLSESRSKRLVERGYLIPIPKKKEADGG